MSRKSSIEKRGIDTEAPKLTASKRLAPSSPAVESRWGLDRTRTSPDEDMPHEPTRVAPVSPPVSSPHPGVPPENLAGLGRGKSSDG
jgi:hypothetical protein